MRLLLGTTYHSLTTSYLSYRNLPSVQNRPETVTKGGGHPAFPTAGSGLLALFSDSGVYLWYVFVLGLYVQWGGGRTGQGCCFWILLFTWRADSRGPELEPLVPELCLPGSPGTLIKLSHGCPHRLREQRAGNSSDFRILLPFYTLSAGSQPTGPSLYAWMVCTIGLRPQRGKGL